MLKRIGQKTGLPGSLHPSGNIAGNRIDNTVFGRGSVPLHPEPVTAPGLQTVDEIDGTLSGPLSLHLPFRRRAIVGMQKTIERHREQFPRSVAEMFLPGGIYLQKLSLDRHHAEHVGNKFKKMPGIKRTRHISPFILHDNGPVTLSIAELKRPPDT
ncbi:MAG: hypothetical protein A3K90_06535 [Pelodictyon luteolum]|uniref:Uncharacterized protein n=1 Tax=Pelodictyon luteolum TaxID=1100 RepID=A0A165LRI0_PELLU|nr:hypothetical protein [Pelodictyon luteolum]KZK74337.1 MAG: hypothetical protein A3K90_06535 [Pelodictyon luteolum]